MSDDRTREELATDTHGRTQTRAGGGKSQMTDDGRQRTDNEQRKD